MTFGVRGDSVTEQGRRVLHHFVYVAPSAGTVEADLGALGHEKAVPDE